MAGPADMRSVSNLAQAGSIAWRWAVTFNRREPTQHLEHHTESIAQPAAPSPDAAEVAAVAVSSEVIDPPRTQPPWSIAGALAAPIFWIANLMLISVHPRDVVHVGRAAMRVPNPRRTGRKTLPEGVAFTVALVIAGATLVAALLAQTSAAGPGLRFIGYLTLAAVAAVFGACIVQVIRQLRTAHLAGRLGPRRAELTAAGHDVVVGSNFGAWPRDSGDGGELFTAIRAELARDHITMIVTARDAGIANWYVREQRGHRHDPTEHPLHVEWVNP